jgi:hypothetical protein
MGYDYLSESGFSGLWDFLDFCLNRDEQDKRIRGMISVFS